MDTKVAKCTEAKRVVLATSCAASVRRTRAKARLWWIAFPRSFFELFTEPSSFDPPDRLLTASLSKSMKN